jgi:hypothetical protein
MSSGAATIPISARAVSGGAPGRHFYLGAADGRKADFLHWRRCEVAVDGTRKPSTVYDAIGASQVAKASFSGMRLLHRLDGQVAIWPFDPGAARRHDGGGDLYHDRRARRRAPRGRSKMRSAETLDAALLHLGSRAHDPWPSMTTTAPTRS